MKLNFNKINLILLIVAVLATIIGYIVMGMGDKHISPIILVIAYVVLFPLAIMVGTNSKSKLDKK